MVTKREDGKARGNFTVKIVSSEKELPPEQKTVLPDNSMGHMKHPALGVLANGDFTCEFGHRLTDENISGLLRGGPSLEGHGHVVVLGCLDEKDTSVSALGKAISRLRKLADPQRDTSIFVILRER